MKKYLILLLLCVGVLSLAGCNKKTDIEVSVQYVATLAPTETPSPTSTPVPTPTPVPTVMLAGEAVPLTATEVTVQAEEELTLLEQFFALEKVDASALTLSVEQIEQFQAQFPEATLICGVQLFGLEVDAKTEELDLHEIEMSDPHAVFTAVSCLPNLTKVNMCKCGLTNEQMEILVNAYPEVKFVWEVKMGPHTLRTDIVGFSTKNPGKVVSEKSPAGYAELVKKTVRLTNEDIQVLKYCTDLVALDLGHNNIDDISVLQYLPKLQILILADNKLTDISVFRELPELVYVEIFMNRIEDLSPLEGHDKLLDLNLCQNRVTDLSPLYELTQLERVWCSMNPTLTGAEARALREKLPNAEVNSTTDDDTGDGWREHERYFWMKEYFADNSPYNPS